MWFNNIHKYFSFRRLFTLVAGLAVVIQFIIIIYNHLSGYLVLNSYTHFFLRLFTGSLFSLLTGFLVTYPDLFVISYLNKTAPWGKNIFKRVTIQLGFTILIASAVAVIITILINRIKAYDDNIVNVIITNVLIYVAVNVLVMSIFEGWILFIERGQAKKMADNLQLELSQIKFEMLKSQINPHFMFNSLNVLSGLITVDVVKAQLFIDEFSQIYRYVLETIEQPVVSLKKELEFVRSYLYLQQIRHGENLTFSVNIKAELLPLVVPPLSLQVLLENAIKHNIVNESKPLKIEILGENSYLIVKNNIQPKISGVSTGLGLKNLVKRYALISNQKPSFQVVDNYYVARIPLIKIDSDEYTNN